MQVSTAVHELAGDRVEPVDLIHGLDLLVLIHLKVFFAWLHLAGSGLH